MPNAETPRYVPSRSFPAYAFVGGGRYPHPRRDPGGHRYGLPEPHPDPLDPGMWRESDTYLWGIDLFNHGYYWEAHEQWEALWIAAGRGGSVGAFMKGLIKLAAAGIKARQGRPRGVRRHAVKAAEHFRAVLEGTASPGFAGLDLGDLVGFARSVQEGAAELAGGGSREEDPVVFDRSLQPR